MKDGEHPEEKDINEDHWLEMQKPLDSVDAADKAIEGFWDEVYALRTKYRIAGIYVICKVRMVYETGKPCEAFASMHAGNELEREAMTAWAFGREQSARQERMLQLFTEAGSAIRDRSRSKK